MQNRNTTVLPNRYFIFYAMKMDFTGKVLTKTPIESIGNQGLTKQSLILEEIKEGQYKDSIMVEFFWEKCAMISELRSGDTVKVLFNPRAKEYNGRRYNSMNGWKVEVVQKWSGSATAQSSQAETLPYDDNQDDLPF